MDVSAVNGGLPEAVFRGEQQGVAVGGQATGVAIAEYYRDVGACGWLLQAADSTAATLKEPDPLA